MISRGLLALMCYTDEKMARADIWQQASPGPAGFAFLLCLLDFGAVGVVLLEGAFLQGVMLGVGCLASPAAPALPAVRCRLGLLEALQGSCYSGPFNPQGWNSFLFHIFHTLS